MTYSARTDSMVGIRMEGKASPKSSVGSQLGTRVLQCAHSPLTSLRWKSYIVSPSSGSGSSDERPELPQGTARMAGSEGGRGEKQ